MKKLVIVALLVSVTLSQVFAVSDDYIAGYKQGYLDHQLGKSSQYPNTTQVKTIEDSLFMIKYFVDSFGDPTDTGYISQKVNSKGTFSNSATTNSDIKWYLILAKDEVAFVIYEYSRTRITGSSGYPDVYDVAIKTSDGKVYNYTCKNYSDRISFQDIDINSITDVFLKEGDIKISIKENSKYSVTSYNLGTINCDGMKELYSMLK